MRLAFFCLLFLFISPLSFGQTSGKLAELIYLKYPDCLAYPPNGEAEFRLLGPNQSSYKYYWSHGPTTLKVKGLKNEQYTFVVISDKGCVERYDIDLSGRDCVINSVVEYIGGCTYKITLEVLVGGNPAPEAGLNINWSGGYNNGGSDLERFYYVGSPSPGGGNQPCVSVELNGGCCSEYFECFTLPIPSDCEINDFPHETPEIVVNEFFRKSGGEYQFVELLVLGNGDCGEVVDIRGYHLDDNNGDMIEASSDFLGMANPASLGVNLGFLTFTYNDSWADVPAGSLIVVQSGGTAAQMLPPDPFDADTNGVYVLSPTDTLFYGRQGTWDNSYSRQDYYGGLIPPGPDLIELSSLADGIQVRDTSGNLVHGVAYGKTYSSEDTSDFPLWVSPTPFFAANCWYELLNPWDKNDFECVSSGSETMLNYSPGTANSESNGNFISFLKECTVDTTDGVGKIQFELPPNLTQVLENSFSAFPNPFLNRFTIRYSTEELGGAKLHIRSASGSLVFSTDLYFESHRGEERIELNRFLPAGIYFVSLKYPSGDQKHIRLTTAN